jgi:hypothetical protein
MPHIHTVLPITEKYCVAHVNRWKNTHIKKEGFDNRQNGCKLCVGVRTDSVRLLAGGTTI